MTGKTASGAVVYIAPTLLVVPFVAVLAFFGAPHPSQSMNHTSFPGVNHKLDSFYRHVLLTKKMYIIDSLSW